MNQPLHPVFTELQAWEVKLMELRLARRAARRNHPKYWNPQNLAADKPLHGGMKSESTNTQEV